MATSPDAVGTDRRITPVRALLIAAGVMLFLFLVWFVFLRADEVDVEATAPAPAPAAAAPEPQQTVSPAKKNDPVETFEVFAPKDPFDPLISPATAGGATGGGAAAGPGGVTGQGTTTTTGANGATTTTTTTGTGTAAGGGGGGGQAVGGRRVRVIDVFASRNGRRAQVQVDGTVYTVDEGERFANNFELLSTSAQCATMLFGDDEFTLCEGEEILK
ncbi:MAG: hypothetical protein M3N53_10815 [Actinomycetota bacterium]|nr:hypothetical protein [Actinomycetota bacterium]